MGRRILEGVRVLDFTQVVAGPLCTRMLADLGAEIVKVDRIPDARGGPVRTNGSVATNLGKRSLALDLSRAEAVEVARELAAGADVVIENFRPGVMDSLGLGWDALSAGHERLIYASISGFGQTGAERERRAYGATAHAEAGLLWVQQQAHDDGEPLAPGITVADIATGQNAFAAILAALYDRLQTGRGQRIDVTLMESQLAMLFEVAHAPLNRPEAEWTPFRHPVYRARDGYITLNPGPPHNWPRIAAGLGHPEVEGPPPENQREVAASWVAERTVAELEDGLRETNAAFGIVRSMPELLAQPYLAQRGMIAEVPDTLDGTVRVIASPLHMSEADTRPAGPAPLAGEHTRALLRELLDYDDGRIEALLSSGATAEQPVPPA
jgi:crotonobetainyl-CoA:carnitine CoA-transferase CaiB-like acyl-CoA transferase